MIILFYYYYYQVWEMGGGRGALPTRSDISLPSPPTVGFILFYFILLLFFLLPMPTHDQTLCIELKFVNRPPEKKIHVHGNSSSDRFIILFLLLCLYLFVHSIQMIS